MAVSQPPISEDIVESSWQYEVTRNVIEMEIYVKPGGRVDFTVSDRELLWMLSSIPITV